MDSDPVERAVAAALAVMDPGNDPVHLVAYSGGPDSTALLVATVRHSVKPVRAIHVDHALRPDSERTLERAVVTSVCTKLGIRLTVARIPPGAIERYAARSGIGIEAAARIYRYRAIRILASRLGTSSILTGHTLDDTLETVLMRFLKGAGVDSLGGIPSGGASPARPLLACSRTRIMEYLRKTGVPYSTDSSNRSPAFLRNRVRNEIVPVLDSCMPGWRRSVGLASEKARVDATSFGAMCDASGSAFRRNAGAGMETSLALFQRETLALKLRLLMRASGRAGGSYRLSWRMARDAIAAIGSGRRAYGVSGIRLHASAGRLVLEDTLDFPRDDGYFVIVPGPGVHTAGAYRFCCAWTGTTGGMSLRDGSFAFPLVIRSRLPGDRIRTEAGDRMLDDLFREWRIPSALRSMVPVVEDASGIVSVFGLPYGGRNRYRPGPEIGTGRCFSIAMKGARVPDGSQ